MMRRGAFVGWLALLVACTSEQEAPVEQQGGEDELISGTQAADGQWPSTLLLTSGCTASKVGPRHILLAAHCVEGDAAADYAPGATLQVTNKPLVDYRRDTVFNRVREVQIEKTVVHPIWKQEKANAWSPDGQDPIEVWGVNAPPDVAVVVLTETSASRIKDIPTASVDLAPVNAGDPIAIMGYGCEQGASVTSAQIVTSKLKFQKTQALPLSSQDHEGSVIPERPAGYRANLGQQYLFSPGFNRSTKEASICPGDSGGPVYRDNGKANVIVGVNAYYSFKFDDPKGISVTNWHTRLDTAGRADVGSWLAQLGVQVQGTPLIKEHYDGCVQQGTPSHSICGPIRAYWDYYKSTLGAPQREARYETSEGSWVWAQRFPNHTLWLRNGQVQAVLNSAATSACGSVTATGVCQGKSFVSCVGGKLQTVDCSASGKTCGTTSKGVPGCK